MKDYIPELSEIRMVRRAPGHPVRFSTEDAAYVENILRRTEKAFGLDAFPGQSFPQLTARALIKTLIDWWRGLEPTNGAQTEAHRAPRSATRLPRHLFRLAQEKARR